MRQEKLVSHLREVWAHGVQFHRDLSGADDPVLAEALAELGTTLEELRVTEEQLRADEAFVSTVQSDRERYRALFEEAPVAYLVTDRDGLVRQANRHASALLGVDRHWLLGKPLASFVLLEDRKAFRQRLLRARIPAGEWDLRLQPRMGAPVGVRAMVGTMADPDGASQGLAWLLRELPPQAAGLSGLLAGRGGQLDTGESGWPDWEALSTALHELAASVVAVLGADGAGLVLAGASGEPAWVSASDESVRAFEQAQWDLQEGPGIAAMADKVPVATEDVRGDPRWLRLASVAAPHGTRSVLAAPVLIDGRTVGTCSATSRSPRRWSPADTKAIDAFAAVLGRLLAHAAEASRQAGLIVQLGQALESRIAIEQAKGMLMARLRIDEQAAFERLRHIARSSSRKITEVAADVVSGRLHVGPPRPSPVDGRAEPGGSVTAARKE
jgi:PAS domain S-box-containing protein